MAELRWNLKTQTFKINEKVDAFIADVTAVCEKHGLSIGHEDGHGAFIVEGFASANIAWLSAAQDDTDSKGN